MDTRTNVVFDKDEVRVLDRLEANLRIRFPVRGIVPGRRNREASHGQIEDALWAARRLYDYLQGQEQATAAAGRLHRKLCDTRAAIDLLENAARLTDPRTGDVCCDGECGLARGAARAVLDPASSLRVPSVPHRP